MKCRTNVGKFSFPKEEDKLKKWMTSLRIVRPKIVGVNGPRLCIDHFSQSQFIHKNCTRKIPKPAEPFIPQFYSFSDVDQMGTKIIGKMEVLQWFIPYNVNCGDVKIRTLPQQNFKCLLITPGRRDNRVFILRSLVGIRITQL